MPVSILQTSDLDLLHVMFATKSQVARGVLEQKRAQKNGKQTVKILWQVARRAQIYTVHTNNNNSMCWAGDHMSARARYPNNIYRQPSCERHREGRSHCTSSAVQCSAALGCSSPMCLQCAHSNRGCNSCFLFTSLSSSLEFFFVHFLCTKMIVIIISGVCDADEMRQILMVFFFSSSCCLPI